MSIVLIFQQYSNVEHILEPKSLISVMSLTDLAIKRIIRMTKKINSFTTMCQADQIALLKGGCTELMILRSVFNYDPDKNSWRVSTTMYNFQDSTDTLIFWTHKWAINKNFCFSSDFDETWWRYSYPCVLQFYQVSSKSDEKQKSFINSPFFCSEFQSVSRIVKIVHSGWSVGLDSSITDGYIYFEVRTNFSHCCENYLGSVEN